MFKHEKKYTKNGLKIFILCAVIILCIILIIETINLFDKNDNSKQNNSNQEKTTDQNPKIEKNEFEKIKYYKSANLDRYIKYKKNNSQLSDEKIVLYTNIGIDQDFYTNITDSPNQNTNTILVNKFYQVDKDYIPNDLELIDSKYQIGNKKMTHDATIAFNEMAKSAKEEGYNIRAISTYRSYEYQDGLYKKYVKIDGTAKADTYSARPGHSEHQTGLAVDVDNIKMGYTNFALTNEFSWMKENCYKYGFILRYTTENEFITGYKNEPWHYRYVGVEIATKMKEENISSYEEYYFMYLDK